MEIGAVLAEARKSLGLTQRVVAEALDVTPQYVCDLELGNRPFPTARVPDLPPLIREKVAAALIATLYAQIDDLSKWLPKVG